MTPTLPPEEPGKNGGETLPRSPSLVGGSLRLLFARVVSSAAAFLSVLVLARALEPSGRGSFAFVAMASLIVAGVSSMGLIEAAIVFAAKEPRRRARLLGTLGASSVLSSATLGAIVAGALAALPGIRPAGLDSAGLVALGLAPLALSSITNTGFFLLGCSRFSANAVVMASAPVLFLVALVITVGVQGDLTVRAALVVWVATLFGGAAIGWSSASGVSGLGRPEIALVRPLLRFGVRAWPGAMTYVLNARADQVLMGFLVAEAVLGQYAVAVNASEITLYLPVLVTQALLPRIAASGAGERLETTLHVLRTLLVLTVCTVAIGAACSPLLTLVFGNAYEAARVPFLLLLPGAIGFTVLAVLGSAFLASSAPLRSSLGWLSAFLVGIALDLALIPPFGAEGAAIAASAAFWAGAAVSIGVFRVTTNVSLRDLAPGIRDAVFVLALARRLLRRMG